MNLTYYATKLLNKHEGQIAFVCGAGPSFYNIMCSYYFSNIFEHIVISVNSSILAMPWIDRKMCRSTLSQNRFYWISNDSLCLRWSWWDIVKQSKCIKIVRDSWEKFENELEGFLYFSPRLTPVDVIDEKEHRLAYCSSVPTAIDLAIQMGCKRVFLLGVDHKEVNGRKYFWEFMDSSKRPKAKKPAQEPWEQRKELFETNKVAFKALRNFAEKKSVSIMNCECGVDSYVNEFVKIKWENIWQKF